MKFFFMFFLVSYIWCLCYQLLENMWLDESHVIVMLSLFNSAVIIATYIGKMIARDLLFVHQNKIISHVRLSF